MRKILHLTPKSFFIFLWIILGIIQASGQSDRHAKIGMNIGGIGPGNCGYMFKDAFKMSSFWTIYGTGTADPNLESGDSRTVILPIDANGWPNAGIPYNVGTFSGKNYGNLTVGNVCNGPNNCLDYPLGDYYVFWEGSGQLSFTQLASGVVNNASTFGTMTAPGVMVPGLGVSVSGSNVSSTAISGTHYCRIKVTSRPWGQGIFTQILQSLPAPNHIKNINIVYPNTDPSLGGADAFADPNNPSYYLKKPFHPKFIYYIDPFPTSRFMDFMGTNGVAFNTEQSWTKRKPATYYTQATGTDGDRVGNSPAFEYIIKMSNETQMDPWINIPVCADNDFFLNMAQLFKDSLDPGLHLYLELGNEVWNYGGPFHCYFVMQTIATTQPQYGGNATLAMADIEAKMWKSFHDVFSTESFRIHGVLMGQSCCTYVVNGRMALHKQWGTDKYYDYFGMTWYYDIPGNPDGSPKPYPATISPSQINDIDQLLIAQDRNVVGSNAWQMNEHAKLAKVYNKRIAYYEGGKFGWELKSGHNYELSKQDPTIRRNYRQILDTINSFPQTDLVMHYADFGGFSYWSDLAIPLNYYGSMPSAFEDTTSVGNIYLTGMPFTGTGGNYTVAGTNKHGVWKELVANLPTPQDETPVVSDTIASGLSMKFASPFRDSYANVLGAAKPDALTDNFTLEAWIKSKRSDLTQDIIAYSNSIDGNSNNTVRINDQNQLEWIITDRYGVTQLDLIGPIIKLNKWHHIAWSRGASGYKLYVNGTLVQTAPLKSGSYAANRLVFGGLQGTFSVINPYFGELDEVRIWNGLEINQLTLRDWMCKIVRPNHPQYAYLSNYYPCNTITGNGIYDAKTKSINGFLVNYVSTNGAYAISGAPVGEESINTYPSNWSVASLNYTNPVGNDIFSVYNIGMGNPDGVHIYAVNRPPKFNTIPDYYTGISQKYYGVFMANGDEPTYGVTYIYQGNPAANSSAFYNRLLKRDDYSDSTWINTGADVDEVMKSLSINCQEKERSEYTLGVRFNQLSNRPGSGRALYFNGTNAKAHMDYFYRADSAYTISFWASSGGNGCTMWLGNAATGRNAMYQSWGDGNYSYRSHGNDLWTTSIGNIIGVSNSWNHYVTVKKGDGIFVYVNGVLAVSGTYRSLDSDFNELNLGSPSPYEWSPGYWRGAIDELSVWSTGFTEDEVRSLMCKKITPNHPQYCNLQAYFRFDEGVGNVVENMHGSGDLVLTNTQWVNSEASLGDESVYNYNKPYSLSMAHPDGDKMDFNYLSNNNFDITYGTQMYRVDAAPTGTVPSGIVEYDSSRYWGVYPVTSQTWNKPRFFYSLTYNYGPDRYINLNQESKIQVLDRNNRGPFNWNKTDFTATQDTINHRLTIIPTRYTVTGMNFNISPTVGTELIVPNHGFQNCDNVTFIRTAGGTNPTQSNNSELPTYWDYMVSVVDQNTIRIHYNCCTNPAPCTDASTAIQFKNIGTSAPLYIQMYNMFRKDEILLGSGTQGTFNLIHDLPATIPGILGSKHVCAGASGLVYKLPKPLDPGTKEYIWSGSAGLSVGISNSDTVLVSIAASMAQSIEYLTVVGVNKFGRSTPPTVLAITVSGTSYLAANIAGPICENQGQTNVLYSISNVSPTPYSYLWTITTGASITGINTGTSIGVDFDTTSNKVTVSVYAIYACGTSLINNAIVNVNTRPRSNLFVTGQAVCSSNAFPYGIIAIAGAQAGITYKAYDGSLLVSSATGFGADLELYVPKSKLLPTGIHKYLTITAEAASCPVAATTLTGVADMLMNDPLSNADLNVSIVGPPGPICAFLGGALGFTINDFTITVSGTKKDVEYVSILSGYDYLYGASQTSHVNGDALILNVQPQQYPWFIRYNTPVGIGVRAQTPGCGIQIMNSQVMVTFIQGTKVALPTKPMGPGVDAAPWMGNSAACGAYASTYYTTAWGGDQNTFYNRLVSVPVVEAGNVLTFSGAIGATMAVNDVLYLYSAETPPGTYPPGLLTYDVWSTQKFYVKSINTTTGVFQLSQTLGGVAMNITTSGANLVFWAPVTIDFVQGSNYFTIPARFGPHGLRLYSHIDFKDASNGIPVDLGQFNPAPDHSFQGNGIYYVSSISGNNIQISTFGMNYVWQKSQPFTVGWGKVNLTSGSTAGSTSVLRLQDNVVLPGTVLRDMDENVLGVIASVIDQYNFTLQAPFTGTTSAYTYSWMSPGVVFTTASSVVITTPSDADDNGFDWNFGPIEAIISVTGLGGTYDAIDGTYKFGSTANTSQGHVKNGITIYWANTFTGNATVSVVAKNSCSRSNMADHLPGQPWYSWTSQSIPIISQIPVIPGAIQGAEIPYCQAPSQTNYSAISPNATGGYEWQLLNAGTSYISGNGRSTITVSWQSGFEGLPTLRVRAIGCDGIAGSAWSSSILTIGGLAAGAPVITGNTSYCKGTQASNFGTQIGATGILNWALFPSPAQDDIYSSMLLYFPFNNGAVNEAFGSSSLGNIATALNGNTFTADKNAVSNKALRFPAGNYFWPDYNANINFNNKMTVAMWVYPEDLSTPSGNNFRTLLNKDSYRLYIRPNGQIAFACYSDNGITSIFPTVNIGGGNATTIAGMPSVLINQWTHIALTFSNDMVISRANVYINGALAGTITAPGQNMYGATGSTHDLFIGGEWAGGNKFKGVMDEIIFYKRVLSPSNIQALYTLNANPIALPDMSYAGSIDRLSGTVTWNPTFTGIVNVSANSVGCTDGIPYSYYPVTVLSRPIITNVATIDPVSCAVGSSGKTLITFTGVTVPLNTGFDADLIGNDLVYEHSSILTGNYVITINSGITVGTYLEDVTIRQNGSLCASNTYTYDYQVGGNVQPDLALAVNPKDLFPVCINQTTGITVANSELNAIYQAFTGAGVNIGTTVAGTGATITLSGFSFAVGGAYPIHVRVSNPACGIYTMTGVATIQVNFPVNAGTITGPSGTVCNGTSATLTLSGYNGVIQWQIFNAGAYQDILGENFNTIILGLQTVGGTFTYRAKVQNTGCSQVATSTGITLTVNGVGSIAGINAGSICNTSSMLLTLSGYTSGAVKWFTSTNFEATYSQIPGANSYILSVPGFTFIGLNYYKAEVTFGICAPVTTSSYHIGTQNVGPSGTITGPSSGLCSPSSNVLNLTNYNGFIQWVAANDNVNYTAAGGNTSALGININSGLGLSYYKAIVTDLSNPLLCPGTTTSFVITVTSYISAGTMTGYNAVDICQGSPYSLNMTGYSGDKVILQVSNGNFISGLIAEYPFDNSTVDVSGNSNNGLPQGSPLYTNDRWGVANSAIALNGSSQFVATPIQLNNPQSFSLSLWFKTTSSQGGKLAGFGNNQYGTSGNYDRHLYLTNAGKIIYGNNPGGLQTIQSPLTYNDGNWHNVIATLSSATGMNLYIDGVLIGSNPALGGQNFIGFWKIGFDNVGGWPNAPSSNYLNGSLDDVMIFNKDVSPSEVNLIYNMSAGSSFSIKDVTTFTGLTGTDVTIPIGPHSLAGTYFYRVMVYNGICSPVASTSYKYIVHSAPGMNLSYSLSAYCNTSSNPIPTFTSFTGGYFASLPTGLSVNTLTGIVDLSTSSIGSYIVSYNISVSGCGINQRFAPIVINSLPGLSLSYLGSPYCQGLGTRSATYSTVPGGYFSAGTGLSISTLSGLIDLSTSNSGSYTVSYSVSVVGCGLSSTTGIVTINTSPGLTLNYPGSPYCINTGNAIATAPTIAGGYFSTVAGLSLNTTTGTINLNVSNAGSYTIIYNISIGGCGLTQTSTGVTLNSLPGLSLSYSGNPYCQNSSIAGIPTYNAVPGGIFSTVAGLSINPGTGVIDLSSSAGGMYTITYSTTVSGCGMTTTTAGITINTIPGLNISYPAGPNCQGGSTVGAIYSPVTGAYFTANPTGLSVNSLTGDIILSSSTGGNYTVSYNVSVAGCNVVSQSTAVSVTGLALAGSISNPNPVCSLTGVTLSNTGASGTLQWQVSVDNGLSWTDLAGATSSTYGTTANGIKYYRVTAHNGSCPLVTGSGVQLSPVEAPWITTFSYPVISGQSQYCVPRQSTTIGLNISSSGSGTFNIQPALIPIQASGNLPIDQNTPAATYMITYSISGAGVCNDVSTTTSVVIQAPLTSGVSFNYSQNPVCSNTQVTLTTTGPTLGTYTQVTALPGVMVASDGRIVYNANLTGRQEIIVKFTASNVCKDSYLQTLTVVGQPVKPQTPYYGSTEFCKTSIKEQLTIYTTSGVFLSDGKPGLAINSLTGAINAGSELKTYGIVYRLNDDGICGTLSSDSAYVQIKSSKAGMLSLDKPQTEGVCEGDSIHITLTGNEGTISWIYNTQTLTGLNNNNLGIQSGIGDQNITAISSKDNCPGAIASYMIASSQKSKGGLSKAKDQEVCGDHMFSTQIDLTGSVGTIQWQMSDDSLKNYTEIENSLTASTTELTIPELKKYGSKKYYKAIVKSGACPSDESSITVVKVCKPDNYVPNALTPNSGDNNSTWDLQKLKLTSKAEIRVFNRYGTEVYYATGDRVKEAWNGSGLAAGTYYYVIKRHEDNLTADELKVISGAVTIIK